MLARERGGRPSAGEARAKLGQLDLPPSVVPVDPQPPSPTATTAQHPAAERSRWRSVAIGALVIAVGAGGYAAAARSHPATAPVVLDGPDQMNLLLDASNWQAKMDGAKCLASLDAFDKSPKRTLPDSFSLDGGAGGVRSACTMLIGKCEEGKKLYREWAPVHGMPMDAALYALGAEQMAGIYCPEAGTAN
jgi:hypothetical protein